MAANDWSLGNMGPFGIEAYAFQGPPDPFVSGEYGSYHNFSRRDLRLLDLIGWYLDDTADFIDPADLQPEILFPFQNDLIEPDTMFELVRTSSADFSVLTVFDDPGAYHEDIVLFTNPLSSDQYTFAPGLLQRGTTYYVYLQEVNDGGSVETGGTVVRVRCHADQNCDGLVTPTDFNAWINNYNNLDPKADVNESGMVEPTDFNAWIAANNAGC